MICAFQPHTYTRTKELFDQFVQVLQLPDKVLLAEIFAARETDTLGISSRDLAQRIPGAEFCPTLEEVAQRLAQLAQPGDLILTVGAGTSIWRGSACWRSSEARTAADPMKTKTPPALNAPAAFIFCVPGRWVTAR